MIPLALLDAAMRILAIGELLLIALVIGRGRAPMPIRLCTAALLFGVAAYLTVSTTLVGHVHGSFWPFVQFAGESVPLTLWIFAHLLFERAIDRRALAAGLVALFACWIGLNLISRDPSDAHFWLAIAQRSVSLILTAHAILIAIGERGDDLIEKRRRLRVGFVVVVGALSIVVLLLEMIFGFRGQGPEILLAQAFAILVATTAMGVALLQSDPELLFDPAGPAPAPSLSPAEHVLNHKLSAAISASVYREPGLTIGVLAERLGVPEHRLRSLINQRLGYRNFSAFLNHHRIAEAKALLADPARVDLPILTIAMDLGYGSLAPFNRAFREATGTAPSTFRRTAILTD